MSMISKLSRYVALVTVLGASLWALPATAQATAAPLEYQVKASYLYNFMRFITWPDDVFAGARRFNLCVLGAERFGAALDALASERIEDREIVVRKLDQVGQARGARCHLLFIAAGAEPTDVSGERGMLVVGEAPGFLGRGGIINLIEVGGRIRFEINQAAAQRANLVVSSRLLSLAKQP